MLQLKQLTDADLTEIQTFYADVFTKAPWNDDWSDDNQLRTYLLDLVGNRNSLSLGYFENETLTGLALGSVLHWYAGTEYHIQEFCIRTDVQGKGLGTRFLKAVEDYLQSKDISAIFLQTERAVPAFSFYLKNGFTHLSDHVSFYKHCGTADFSEQEDSTL